MASNHNIGIHLFYRHQHFVYKAPGTGNDLRKGMLVGCVFPLILILSLILLKGMRKPKST